MPRTTTFRTHATTIRGIKGAGTPPFVGGSTRVDLSHVLGAIKNAPPSTGRASNGRGSLAPIKPSPDFNTSLIGATARPQKVGVNTTLAVPQGRGMFVSMDPRGAMQNPAAVPYSPKNDPKKKAQKSSTLMVIGIALGVAALWYATKRGR